MVLTDQVYRTLFTEYAEHRAGDRGREEIGWVLLGRRERDSAVVLATLPAGSDRDAGEDHVRFNLDAQAVGSRLVRRTDKRLTLLGVVHTHPGTLRHPSPGDLRGDREWVPRLRGREGVFGIGTVDSGEDRTSEPVLVADSPAGNVHRLAGLRFDWYTLAAGDRRYQPLPVELTIGPDLAAELRPLWPVIEAHAAAVERLARQQTGLQLGVAPDPIGPALTVQVRLSDSEAIQVVVTKKDVRFFHLVEDEVRRADLPAGTKPDHGVYLLLAELAARG